ncbi:hypothetical protein PPTG_07114 [Phytophthora nicotianae INRA-310]|uniref:Chromo domain-containing protein n=1 Tax=Phytophthora nicotianae (strain INRA-310) TaxID=761204 RepID=W2QQU1_PHYN3|nr:hypothetical protein PPTG_07114 [Phytophthora nicotianae INRA-310]ETN14864.1 hypothetical protein PPTG_07114 [Phytophthora nicotianae INRA-310]
MPEMQEQVKLKVQLSNLILMVRDLVVNQQEGGHTRREDADAVPASADPQRGNPAETWPPPALLDEHGEPHYHVERFVARRRRRGRTQYLVKWKGYPHLLRSSVPEAEALLREHEAEAAVVLDIGMSEFVSNEVAVCPGEDGAEWRSRHRGQGPEDADVVAPRSLSEGYGPHGPEPSVSRDTVSSPRSVGAAAPGGGDGAGTAPPSSGRARSRRERRGRRRASVTSLASDEASNVTSSEAPRDCCEQLYTLVDGVTEEVEDDISLDSLPAAA